MTNIDAAAAPSEDDSSAPQPSEFDRLAALHRTGLLDSEASEPFDRVTRLAARAMNAPTVLVSLVDDTRQWFKSRYGCDLQETEREVAFCSHTVHKRQPLIVPDATRDSRFARNRLVTSAPHIRAYLGVPLFSREGHAVGALCAIDYKPREFDGDDLATMNDFARIVEDAILAHELMTRANPLETEVAQRTKQLQVANDALRLHVKRLMETERAAKVAERKVRAIADGVPVMIGYWNRALQCEFVNAAYRTWFGKRADQIIGMTLSELMGDLYAEAEPHAFSALEGNPQRFDRHIRRPTDRSLAFLEVRYMPDVDENGEVRGFYSLVTDTTLYRQTRE